MTRTVDNGSFIVFRDQLFEVKGPSKVTEHCRTPEVSSWTVRLTVNDAELAAWRCSECVPLLRDQDENENPIQMSDHIKNKLLVPRHIQ
jgi:hypothetical protein